MTEKIIKRPPIVVVLGHVDHGKSSILEAIKDLKITEKESGGITQHIGAYEIEHQGKKITFIDTPGHEAFSAMRSRGAKIADIALLVIAADEGIKEQTKEAISHIKKFGLPMIVVANKMDKPGADPERVQRELNSAGVALEKMGGDVPFVKVSAKTKEGITDLLDIISLVSQMENLEADLEKPAEGEIIETLLDPQKGPLATAIIKEGILKTGDIIATESAFGKVKSLENFQGEKIKEAYPSTPVRILGFNTLPFIGETFKKFSNLEEAKGYLKVESEEPKIKWEPSQKREKNLNIILKTDVLGSLEAIENSLKEINQEEVSLTIIKGEVGNVVENDLKLAEHSQAKIIAFRVKVPKKIREVARTKKIGILEFDVIYDLVEGIEKLMKRMKELKVIEEEIGKIKVLAIFGKIKEKQVIGGRVIEGEVRKFRKVKIVREEQEIGKGRITNLQRNKVDTELVIKGQECGLLIESDTEIQKGDILIVFEEKNLKNS